MPNAMREESIGTALPAEMARVRGLAGIYKSGGPPGHFAMMMMEASLRAADKASAEGDVVGMIRAYKDLQGYSA